AAGGISPGLPREGEAGEQETAEQETAEAAPAEAAEEAKAEEDPRAAREAAQAAARKLQEAVQAKLAPYGAADRRRIAIYDDNNDTFPEINTEAEMAVMAWAISEAAPRFKGRDLYYIKGVNAWRVHVEDWENPYDTDYLQMDRIGENEAFIAAERYEQVEVPGAFSWDPPVLVWQLTETRLVRPYKAVVEEVDTAANPVIAELAQRLPWTVSHGVEPAASALGAKGCADCHSADSHFFFGPVVIDPFGPDAKPVTAPMHVLLGYDPLAIRIGAFREEILKPASPWIVLAVLLIMLLHFALIGRKNGVAYPALDVLRFRAHERLGHLIAMTTVVVLAVTGFFFLLGRHDPLGPWARIVHTYVGYASIVGIIAIFLSWVCAMFPARGDLRWLLKAGGYLGGVKEHLPAGKFNAGQKILFWIAIAACGVLAASGLLMGLYRDIHFPRQELVYTAHDIAALIMILVLMAHVYLAAFVVPHSLNSLFGGKVSSKWADAHHPNWQYTGKTANTPHDKH
ncbi:MAG TPA: formate dehydrogenase subunit gamma, partial [Candidatus Hydrogenedentes bacterium]|nr:formate dehydrogenase subunit gamma [Candidatus Hydrogenedentota bacterium]